MGTPKILISGESGGAIPSDRAPYGLRSRLNADEVSSQCDLATERVITGLLRVSKLPSLCDYYVISMRLVCDSYPLLILCLSPRSDNGMVTGKKSTSKNDEINY